MGLPEHDQNINDLLRRRAEEAIRGQPVNLDGLQQHDIEFVMHELQVYQVELRLQNEELRRVQLDLEISRDQYANLYHFAPVGYCTLNRKGRILEANQTLATLLQVNLEQLAGAYFSGFVDRADQDEFYLHRQKIFKDHQRQVNEIHLRKHSEENILVRMESVIANGDHNQMRAAITDITQQRQMERITQENIAQREVQHLLFNQREQERQQIARDLHDGPIQELTASTFALRTLLMDECAPKMAIQLEAIQSSLQEQIHELRTYAGELRPPTLAKFGLEQAIRSHAEAFQQKYPDLRIQLDFRQTGPFLSEETALPFFRIYQQALANILKHAQASEVQVQFMKDEHQAQLAVQDNGLGFEQPKDWLDLVRQGHLGLVGMRERAEAIGGHLEIHAQAGKGTRVLVTVPL